MTRILKIVITIYLVGVGLSLGLQLFHDVNRLNDVMSWAWLWNAFKWSLLWPYVLVGFIHLAVTYR